MTDRSHKQEKLKQLREASAKRKKPAAADIPGRQRGSGRRGGSEPGRATAPAARGREGLRERLAGRGSARDEAPRRRADAGGQGRPGGAAAGDSRGRLAKMLAERRGKGGRQGAVRQSRTDADAHLDTGQKQRVREFIKQRLETGSADRQATGVDGSGTPLQTRYLGQYDEREGEAPQARIKRKLMRADLMKEFAARKREAEEAREAQARQLTKDASKDMGMLFDEARKPTIGSSPEEIEHYHAQLSIRADWLRATLEEIQAELKMLEQIRAASAGQDLDAAIDNVQGTLPPEGEGKRQT